MNHVIYSTSHVENIKAIAIEEAGADFEECQSARVILDEVQVETRAYTRVEDLGEVTNYEPKLIRIYVTAYREHFLDLQKTKEV